MVHLLILLGLLTGIFYLIIGLYRMRREKSFGGSLDYDNQNLYSPKKAVYTGIFILSVTAAFVITLIWAYA